MKSSVLAAHGMAPQPAGGVNGGARAPAASAAALATAPLGFLHTGFRGTKLWPEKPQEPSASPSARPLSQLPMQPQLQAEEPPQPSGHLLRRHNTLSFIHQCLQSQGDISPNVWKQLLGMLLVWVKLKRRHTDLEETLPDHIVDFLAQLLPRALPQLQQAAMVFALVEARTALLGQPGLREHIDQSVLPKIPVDDASNASCEECPEETLQALAVVLLTAGLTAATFAAAESPWAEPVAAYAMPVEQEPCMGRACFESPWRQLSDQDERLLLEREAFHEDEQLLVEAACRDATSVAGAMPALAGSTGEQQHRRRQRLGQQRPGARRKQQEWLEGPERPGALQRIPEDTCVHSSAKLIWEASAAITSRYTVIPTAHSAEADYATFLRL
mmetsp:Transcript_127107/g.353909  ORF Transcript_127107/g.353909 Transcript_127107/m.353909 type:complete len:386 (-) Transcript_127107:366-1523(-)